MPCGLCWAAIYFAQLFMCTCPNTRGSNVTRSYNAARVIPQVICQFAGWLARFAKEGVVRPLAWENTTFRSYLWQDSSLSRHSYHATKGNPNLCASGDFRGPEHRAITYSNLWHCISVRVGRDLRRSAGQIFTFLSSLFRKPFAISISLCCHLETIKSHPFLNYSVVLQFLF